MIDDGNDASMSTHKEDVMETSVISQALNKVNPLEVSPTNPQNLAPTIAMREPPATKDLVEAKLSRFKSKE